MNLPIETRQHIQYFAYYLFKGTLDPRLISAEFDYLSVILTDRQALVNCFEIFAHAMRTDRAALASTLVASYILALHCNNNSTDFDLAEQAIASNRQQPERFWAAFLDLARRFCNNTFPQPMRKDYVHGLEACGTDAVPAFAVWTNVIEVDETLTPTNASWALRRANERLKLWEGEQPAVKFEEWELEQEIY